MPRALALVACGVGAAMILVALRLSSLGREARGYSRTRGRVVVSSVDEVPAIVEQGGPRFRALIRYTYDVRGRSHESDRIAFGASVGSEVSESDAREWVERYPAGSDVDVWFDPGDPSRAVLVRGIARGQVLAALAIGISLLGFGIFRLAR